MKRGAKGQITQTSPEEDGSSSGGEEEQGRIKGAASTLLGQRPERTISVPKRRAVELTAENPFASLRPFNPPSATKQPISPPLQNDNPSLLILNEKEDGLKERDNILVEIDKLNQAFSESLQKAFSRDRHTDFTSLFPQYSKFRAQIEDRFAVLKEQMKKLSRPADTHDYSLPSPPKSQILVGTQRGEKVASTLPENPAFSFSESRDESFQKLDKHEFRQKTATNFEQTQYGQSQIPIKPFSFGQTEPSRNEEQSTKPLIFGQFQAEKSKEEQTSKPLVFSFGKEPEIEKSEIQSRPFSFDAKQDVVRREEPRFELSSVAAKVQENLPKKFHFGVTQGSPLAQKEGEKKEQTPFKFSFGQTLQEHPPKPFSFQKSEHLPESKPFQLSFDSQAHQEPLSQDSLPFSLGSQPESKPFQFGSQSQEQPKTREPFKFSFGSQEQPLPAFKFGSQPTQPLSQFSFSKPTQPALDEEAEESGGEDDLIPAQEETLAKRELIETGAGEEGETTLWQSRCKLFRFESNNTWNDLGVGLVKLNSKSDTQRRLLVRAEGTGKVLLNVDVKGVVVDYKEERPRELTFISSRDSRRYLLRTKEETKPLNEFLQLK